MRADEFHERCLPASGKALTDQEAGRIQLDLEETESIGFSLSMENWVV